GRVVPAPVPDRQRLSRRPSVLRLVLGCPRPAVGRQGDHRRRRPADRAPARLHPGIDAGGRLRDRQRRRRPLPHDQPPPRARRARRRRQVGMNKRTYLRTAQRAAGKAEELVRGAAKPLRSYGFPYRAPTKPKGVEVPREPSTLGANYDTEWARSPIAKAARGVISEGALRLFVRGIANPEIVGLDRLADLTRLDDPPPVIFAPNHHSHLDTSLMIR